MLQPTTILIGPADRARAIALHWTNRAAYRLAALPDVPDVATVRDSPTRGYAFLVAHLWAMLADERDRRRYPAPEDLAADLSDEPQHVEAYWRTMWRHAFDFDIDNPPPAPPPAAPDGTSPEDPAQKSTSAKP